MSISLRVSPIFRRGLILKRSRWYLSGQFQLIASNCNGFANFYCFIKDYSKVAPLLTKLTSTKTSFCWSKQSEYTFQSLKELFSTVPVLVQPDPHCQFVVEVDASDVDVGVVLSQWAEDGRLHPCAFFSQRLSTAERNYDVGNRELSAVKLALKEWRHWLEGMEQLFLVWTDHNNLAYIQTAKRLNSQQAEWALFFCCFHFTLTYQLGSHNLKPNALSWQFCDVLWRIWTRRPSSHHRVCWLLNPYPVETSVLVAGDGL